jgi:hypothetical protein
MRELAAAGQGQVIALVGDPGVGKSRLFYEFTRSGRMRPWLVLEGTSVSSGRAGPWAPVVDLLKSYFAIAPGDDARRRAEKRCGRSCRRCWPYSTCLSGTPRGTRSLRRSGGGASWTA